MSFIDLSLPERDRFLQSFTGCHIPGYTGHCPTLKFHYGKGFGTDTREIMRKLRDRPLTFDTKPYKHDDPKIFTLKEPIKEKGEELDPGIYLNLPKRPYILGYTGFIPGMSFRYGASFAKTADESVDEFTRRLFVEKRRRDRDRFQCSNVVTKMTCVRGRDDTGKILQDPSYPRTPRKPASKISFELPPIAGYTGHIPRLIGSETSLSRRYHAAAKAGLARLKEEKDRQNHIETAKEAVMNAIACSHSSY